MSRKFACLYLAVALLVSSIWVASADERDTIQQEVQYSAAVEALDAAGLTSRSSNVLPSGEGLALALELGLPDTLLVSPPGAGKTTLLRELVRLISEGGRRVSLIDERAEIAGVWEGAPLFDVGPCTDVMTGAPKPEAAAMLIRAMTPQLLAMDEITTPADVEAARSASGCGVKLLATAHAGSLRELASRPVYRPLLEDRVFRAAVLIERRAGRRRYKLEELGG